MEKNLKKPTSWVGGELSKRDSLFKDGILIRYDRMNKKFQCLYKIRNNMFGVANIGEGYLDEIGFFNLDLAHDIKTPLTVVIGYLSLLDEIEDMPLEQRKKYIELALNKSYRLEELINELFDIAKDNMSH